jgi:hypothetical protein
LSICSVLFFTIDLTVASLATMELSSSTGALRAGSWLNAEEIQQANIKINKSLVVLGDSKNLFIINAGSIVERGRI